MAYLIAYRVGAGSHEGYRHATVLSCDWLEPEFNVAETDGVIVEDHKFDPIHQIRWWFGETTYLDIRVEGQAREVGEMVPDLEDMK